MTTVELKLMITDCHFSLLIGCAIEVNGDFCEKNVVVRA